MTPFTIVASIWALGVAGGSPFLVEGEISPEIIEMVSAWSTSEQAIMSAIFVWGMGGAIGFVIHSIRIIISAMIISGVVGAVM